MLVLAAWSDLCRQFFMPQLILLQTASDTWGTHLGIERLSNILWCIGIIVGTLLIRKPLTRLITRITSYYANRLYDKKYSGYFTEHVSRPLEMLIVVGLFYIAVNQLSAVLNVVFFRRFSADKLVYELRISDVTDKLAMFLVIIFATLTLARIADFIFRILLDKAVEEQERDRQQLYPLIKEVCKIAVWTIGFFWLLGSVFQVNIPALIAGLGIGGVAIALAAKESVENFFASFIIIADKPFRSGDTVRLGSLEGAVERIGFRSTRLRNGDGSVFIIPNKKLIGENLENLSQKDQRKIRLVFTVKYGMDQQQLDSMVERLRTMVRDTTHVRQPVNISLENFGENALQVVIVFLLPEPLPEGVSADFIRHQINLKAYGIIANYMKPFSESTAGNNAASEENNEPTGEESSSSDDGIM